MKARKTTLTSLLKF